MILIGVTILRFELKKYRSNVNKLKPIAPIGVIPTSILFLDSLSHASEPIPIPIAKVANKNVVKLSSPINIFIVYAGICNVITDP